MDLFLLILALAPSVHGVIQQASWKDVLVSKQLVTFSETLYTSAIKAASSCQKTENCILVCKVGEKFKLSENRFESDYYEKRTAVKYQCWTKITMTYIPVKLNQDGLYYHADFSRKEKLSGEQCKFACRRIPGYRSTIIRSDSQHRAISDKYEIPYNHAPKYRLFVGLYNCRGTCPTHIWIDGTPYQLTVPASTDDNARYFILHDNRFEDHAFDSHCLCQGNPNNENW